MIAKVYLSTTSPPEITVSIDTYDQLVDLNTAIPPKKTGVREADVLEAHTYLSDYVTLRSVSRLCGCEGFVPFVNIKCLIDRTFLFSVLCSLFSVLCSLFSLLPPLSPPHTTTGPSYLATTSSAFARGWTGALFIQQHLATMVQFVYGIFNARLDRRPNDGQYRRKDIGNGVCETHGRAPFNQSCPSHCTHRSEDYHEYFLHPVHCPRRNVCLSRHHVRRRRG